MSHEATDNASAYPATVTVPDDGDPSNMTTWMACLQDIINRTAALHDQPAGDTQTIGGVLEVKTAGAITTLSNRITLNAVGTLVINGSGAVAVAQASGQIQVRDGGFFKLLADGDFTTSNGSTFTFGSGTVAKVFCGLQIGENTPGPVPGIVQFNGASGFNGGYAYFLGPDCFNFANGATGQIGGVLTRTGEGRITKRVIAGADPGGGTETYGPGDADTIIAVTLSNPRTYDLSGAALHGDRITIVNRNVTHTIAVTATASAIYVPFGTVPLRLLNASGSRYSVTLEFSDGTGTRPAAGWYLVSEVRVP